MSEEAEQPKPEETPEAEPAAGEEDKVNTQSMYLVK